MKPPSVFLTVAASHPAWVYRPAARAVVDTFDFPALAPVPPSLYSVRLDVLEPLAIHSCRSAVGFAAFIGESQNVLPVHLVVQRIEAKAGRFLRLSCNAVCNAL
jgi:hypothetical protein